MIIQHGNVSDHQLKGSDLEIVLHPLMIMPVDNDSLAVVLYFMWYSMQQD